MIKRDPNTKAILNTDVKALNKYKQERALYKRIEVLNKEVVEIRQVLVRVSERLEQIEN
jgi:hypothetical protein